MKKTSIALIVAGLLSPLTADQVILDDLIVDGSTCVGQDCVNGESFGFDTLRLKENNLRIKFQDTSSTASFPSNDWQITANDSSNGGLNKFSIDDIDHGKTPFTIEAGAPSNALYVEDSGDIGIGTSTPVVDIHDKSGNTPTLRLEQDGSSGWSPQTWDIAGNEANFFIRDATNGSTLPFRIEPGADTNSIVIDATNDIGIGTNTPDASLHVMRTDGTARVHVEDTGSSDWLEMLSLSANGKPYIIMSNTNANRHYKIGINANDLYINDTDLNGARFYMASDGSIQMGSRGSTPFDLSPTGDLALEGTLTDSSDKNIKENLIEADSNMILSKIEKLPLYTWNYIANKSDSKHFGAMAQDFYTEFSFGEDNKHIAPKDAAFIAMAGVQALKKELDEKNIKIEKLNHRILELEQIQARVLNLEVMVGALANTKKDSLPITLK